MSTSHKDLAREMKQIEKKYDEQFQIVFEAIAQLWEEDKKPKKTD